MIKEFQGEYRFLSNFWPSIVLLDGVEYPTVEHAYQASKTTDMHARATIRVAPTPGLAKRIGKAVVLDPRWDERKVDIMRDLVHQKFRDKSLATKLIATYPQVLQEGNSWGDKFWGVDLRTGIGHNVLGRILMEIRGELWNKMYPMKEER